MNLEPLAFGIFAGFVFIFINFAMVVVAAASEVRK